MCVSQALLYNMAWVWSQLQAKVEAADAEKRGLEESMQAKSREVRQAEFRAAALEERLRQPPGQPGSPTGGRPPAMAGPGAPSSFASFFF